MKFASRKWKNLGGGGGRNRVKFRFEVSVPEILGFFMFFGGYGGQNFIFLRIWTAKLPNLYMQDPLNHKNSKITTKYYDHSWKMSKISKSSILDLKSAIAPTMIIWLIYKCHIRNPEVKEHLFWNFEPILRI